MLLMRFRVFPTQADRNAEDFASLWEQLRSVYEEVDVQVASYKHAHMQEQEQQSEYMSKNGSYLNGLHQHMLGGDAQRDDSGLGQRIFKKCAYVADTICRNRVVVL